MSLRFFPIELLKNSNLVIIWVSYPLPQRSCKGSRSLTLTLKCQGGPWVVLVNIQIHVDP